MPHLAAFDFNKNVTFSYSEGEMVKEPEQDSLKRFLHLGRWSSPPHAGIGTFRDILSEL